MKISQEDKILITNLYLSKQYGAQRLLHEYPDWGWKLGSIDSLLRKSHKTGTTVSQPLPTRQRQTAFVAYSGEERCAQSGGQARKASVSS